MRATCIATMCQHECNELLADVLCIERGVSCVLKRTYIHLSICTARPIYFTARPRASEGVVLHLLAEGTSQPRLVSVCGYVGVSVVQRSEPRVHKQEVVGWVLILADLHEAISASSLVCRA